MPAGKSAVAARVRNDPSAIDVEVVKAFQSMSWQRHSIAFAEWIIHAGLDHAKELGHTQMRPAFSRMLVYLDWNGSRISDLARSMDVSKNAVGQVVSEMEGLGYVERVPDPADGRAKIVRYTPRGLALLADAARTGAHLDERIREIIGEDSFGHLRRSLAALCEQLSLQAVDEHP